MRILSLVVSDFADCIFMSEMLVTDIKNVHVWQGHVDFYAAGPQDTLEVCVAIAHFYCALWQNEIIVSQCVSTIRYLGDFSTFMRPNFVIFELRVSPGTCIEGRYSLSEAKFDQSYAITWKWHDIGCVNYQ